MSFASNGFLGWTSGVDRGQESGFEGATDGSYILTKYLQNSHWKMRSRFLGIF
jgi:hypothetical protein